MRLHSSHNESETLDFVSVVQMKQSVFIVSLLYVYSEFWDIPVFICIQGATV